MPKLTQIKWDEPNRENAPPLHIANRGTRYPTLTGVAWLSEFEYVVAHRCGLRLAVFDIRLGKEVVCIALTPHRADDVAAKKVGLNKWEIAISGCYEAVYTTYSLELGSIKRFRLCQTIWSKSFTFSHGVRYDPFGNLCISLHTGEDPRIEIAEKVWHLPSPWGVRNVCFDSINQDYYAVAVSQNPQLEQYGDIATSIWILDKNKDFWSQKWVLRDVHSDDCDIFDERIWLSDQKGDRMVGICLADKRQPASITGDCFDFPHGIAISKSGMLAVTNYGNSSVVIFDLMVAIQEGM